MFALSISSLGNSVLDHPIYVFLSYANDQVRMNLKYYK